MQLEEPVYKGCVREQLDHHEKTFSNTSAPPGLTVAGRS
ncbi:hypothetical protein ASQ66_gp13 [Aeropyrum pernix spindle-shaped virus 1]|nr:hypothetical protein ASQ66_gp13 [Aeropyrum pernix spindle-shaped virus 1]CCD22101.1 TPA: hypothetical protein [Aeropyrum pernix spindle-shaped virus 1]